MSRILGLDLGTNSIGWAIIDNETNKLLNFGVRIFKNPSKLKTTKKKKHSTAIASLNTITILSLILSVFNIENWQFWLNITLTTAIAKITLSNQENQ
jgi:RNase H-fold protein (predicted Holliday junction resolvase)